MDIRIIFIALILIANSLTVYAALEKTQLKQLHQLAEQLIRHQTTGLPGKVSFTIGEIDSRLNLPTCTEAEAFIPAGARLWGNSNIGIRCNGQNPWTIYVPVTVKILTNVVVASRNLTQGHPVLPADLTMQEMDLGQVSGAVITDPAQAIGHIAILNIAPGQPLRRDLLRAPLAIRQGQSVSLRSQGTGYKIASEGRALNNAVEGEVVQVRTTSGRTISGLARSEGIVDIR